MTRTLEERVLERREQAPAGWRWYVLTRAGQLVCDLLVEAGALPARASSSKRRA